MARASDMRAFEESVSRTGKLSGSDQKALQELVYADGKIDRPEADFLVVIHKRVQPRSASFEQFFYKAIKDHILANGKIGPGEAEWLRQMIFFNDRLEDEERKFLQELKGEARETSPEFDALYQECMKLPPEPHTAK